MDTRPDTEEGAMTPSSDDNTTVVNVVARLPDDRVQGTYVVRVSEKATAGDVLRQACKEAHVPLLPSYGLQTTDGYPVQLDKELVAINSVQAGEVLVWVSTDHAHRCGGKCWNAFWFMALLSMLIAVIGLATIGYLYGHKQQNFQYAVIFDAGSSHTSMFIYKWEGEKINSTAVAIQDGPMCKAHGGGISSYANNTAAAGKSLVDCLDVASQRVPSDKQSATSIYLGATAGMRLLQKQNPNASDAVMESVRSTIGGYPFKFVDPKRQARIIPGSEEGVFSWITSNYVTGTFDVHPPTDEVVPELIVSSVGTLDLGGASTQITFIPNKTEHIPDVDHFVTDLYGTNYSLYTHSYLCYGVNEAVRRLQAVLIEAAKFNSSVANPCSPQGSVVNVTHRDIFASPCVSGNEALLHYGSVILPADSIDQDTVYYLHGESNATECRALVTSALFNFTAPCPYDKCSFNGVFQPQVVGEFFAISSYFYLMQFLNLTASQAVNYTDFTAASQSLCAKDWQQVKHMKTAVPKNLPNYCFESIYIDTILVEGYGFKPNSSWKGILFVESISGVDAGWTLGFVINESTQVPASYVHRPLSTVALALLVCLFAAFLLLSFIFARFGWNRCRHPGRSWQAERQGYSAI